MTTGIKTEPSIESEIQHLALEAMRGTDLFVVDVVVRGRQGSRVVEVFIDGDKGVHVDDLASISKQLSFLLESEDLLRGKYHLNVSSPGEQKAFLIPRQYRQHKGRTIELLVRSSRPDEDSVKKKGQLVSSSENDVVLELGSGERKTITFEEIDAARIVMPW
ncbi:MAG: ribosome maturation factor RimP [Rhodothermia bacterium]|nr:MAG: ribosome maturation factor RimP [Rhodothermia bacterium]